MNTSRRLLVLVFLGVGGIEAQTSGSILGQVVDQATMKPLPGANVVVKDTRYGAAADSNGYFEMRNIPPGTYAVEFRHVGYKTKYRIVDLRSAGQIELTVGLEQEAIPLPEVTITDTVNIERLLHQYPRGQVITSKMLLETQAQSLTAALRILAPRLDVSVERSPTRRRPINPRMVLMEMRNILLLIDGRRIYPSGDDIMSDPNWLDKYIDINEVESMVIHRGDDAWIRAGRRGERLDWLLEIKRKK